MATDREKALDLCCQNYEKAIKLVQAERDAALKAVKMSDAKLNRLINLVKNNARNSDTILNQL